MTTKSMNITILDISNIKDNHFIELQNHQNEASEFFIKTRQTFCIKRKIKIKNKTGIYLNYFYEISAIKAT